MSLIAVVDITWVGHNPTYFKQFVQVIAESGHQVWGFCPEPEKVYQWMADKDFDSQRVKMFAMGRLWMQGKNLGVKEKLMTNLGYWFSVAQCIKSASAFEKQIPDLVIFPSIDIMVVGILSQHLIDMIFPFPWTGVYIQPGGYLRMKHWRKFFAVGPINPYSALKSKRCKIIGSLDEGTVGLLQKFIKKKVTVFPDFTDEVSPSMQNEMFDKIVQLANGRKVISVLGLLVKGKGILNVIEAVKRLPEDEYYFVFAGKVFDDEIYGALKKLEESRKNFFSYLYYLDEENFNAIIKASNIVCAAYHNFRNSSNIMTKAALFGKPIIVSKGYLLEERVKKFNTGIAIPEADTDALVVAIKEISNGQKDSARYDEYFKLHSLEMAKQKINEILNQSITPVVKLSGLS